MESSLFVLFLSPTRPTAAQSLWSGSLPWQSSATAQLFAILVFTILQILLLPKLGSYRPFWLKVYETPLAALSLSRALPPHKAGFLPLRWPDFLKSQSLTSFTYQTRRKMGNQGESLSRKRTVQCFPSDPQRVPPSAGSWGSGWKHAFVSNLTCMMLRFCLTTAGSREEKKKKSLRCWAVAFVHHVFLSPFLLAICRVHPEGPQMGTK